MTDIDPIARQRAAIRIGALVTVPVAIAIWFAIFWLSPPLGNMEQATARFAYALQWSCVALLLCLAGGVESVAHRRLFSAAIDPLAGAEDDATRVDLRYLQNTLEQSALFVPALLALSWQIDPGQIHAVTACAVVWIVSRFAFWIGYHRSSAKRVYGLPGMVLSMGMLIYVSARFGFSVAGAAGAVAPILAFAAMEVVLFRTAIRGGGSSSARR